MLVSFATPVSGRHRMRTIMEIKPITLMKYAFRNPPLPRNPAHTLVTTMPAPTLAAWKPMAFTRSLPSKNSATTATFSVVAMPRLMP